MPLAGFLLLATLGRKFPTAVVSAVGAGTVGVSAVLAMWIAAQWLQSPPAGHAISMPLWEWIHVGGFTAKVGLWLDPLSLLMTLVVTVVGFLIHLYSVGYMRGDDGYSRFFAYMNLFVASMLTLVLADNLVMLLLGWEGVGLCSYLLIGFWYTDPANARAARKAFIVTRVGDTAMTIGLLLLFTQLGTLDIHALMGKAAAIWPMGSNLAILAAALLLAGAVGKSAQLPLQTWLPDAMAGPTPVSALIHAATMVTAGVYLIARTHVIFQLAPPVLLAVGVIGAVTLLYAGFSALVQRDLKRILAYSTISQIGYMFLALGAGAFSAAMFHFMTHAFFKSLLFLGAGAVILAMHHEQDIFKMGGLRRRMPVVFWTFLIGASALSAVPLVTSGFYSKDLILEEDWASGPAGHWLFAAGLAGALLTSIYSFRMIFVVFFGDARSEGAWPASHAKTPAVMLVPLVVLAVLSLAGGFLNTPSDLGNISAFSTFLAPVFEESPAGGLPFGAVAHEAPVLTLQALSASASLLGILIAYLFYLRAPSLSAAMAANPVGSALRRWWLSGWGFDWVYDRLFVRPFMWVARVNRDDVIDSFFDAIAVAARMAHRVASESQTGHLRWYAAGIVVGAIVVIGIVVWL